MIEFSCPKDQNTLTDSDGSLLCAACGAVYPVVNGIPVLIDDKTSVFSTADYLGAQSYEGASYGSESDKSGGLRGLYRRAISSVQNHAVLICSLTAEDAVKRMVAEMPGARILVIGAGESDYGEKNIVYSDVSFGRKTGVICDAHKLPFSDGYFDGLVAVAVLEHVADPWCCANEIARVLRLGGLVYASTPFLQPVHMGAHDFTRFTYLGHRRLFNSFEDIESGPVLGPANSMAFAAQHVLLCLSDRPSVRRIMRLIGIFVAAAIKPIDLLFRNRAGAYDGAAAVFFYGRKSETRLSDKAILAMYRGSQH